MAFTSESDTPVLNGAPEYFDADGVEVEGSDLFRDAVEAFIEDSDLIAWASNNRGWNVKAVLFSADIDDDGTHEVTLTLTVKDVSDDDVDTIIGNNANVGMKLIREIIG